jgi:Domain of unknown function (DUF4167)
MRGRSRRGPNPLTRSFESNGPDVKVRGTAQHITEKYVQLARDAHVSGDPVAAESYLQHAEHYYRLIAAAHLAQQAANNPLGDDQDESDEDDFDTTNDRFTFRAPQAAQQNGAGGSAGEAGDQPGFDGPFEERERLPDRSQGDRNGPRRHDRNDRNFRPRHEHSRSDGSRQESRQESRQDSRQEPRPDQGQDRHFDRGRNRRPAIASAQPGLESAEQPILPAFLTAPVRPLPPAIDAASDAPMLLPAGELGDVRAGPFRARRRRRPRGEDIGESDKPTILIAE